jgi:hypothetical protein
MTGSWPVLAPSYLLFLMFMLLFSRVRVAFYLCNMSTVRT